MKFINRLFLIIAMAFGVSLYSCVESTELSENEMENIALRAWMELNRPDLLDNYQPQGGYYVDLLDEGHPDSLPVRHNDAWVWFDVTCRDLKGNVVLSRNDEIAQMQNSYTSHTHYAPYFLYCGVDNTSMPEGTYMSIRNKLKIGNKEYAARYGTKMRLYLPSSIAGGDAGMSGDGGYEGQYSLDENRPMIIDVQIWGHVNNPLAYEDQWVRSFATANGGIAPVSKDEESKKSAALRRSYYRVGAPTRAEEEQEAIIYDNKWRLAVDSIAGLYINYKYTPRQALVYDCLGQDTLIYKDQTVYNRGKLYGQKSVAQLDKEIEEVLIKRFGEGLNPAEAEPTDSVTEVNVWYITRKLDGFIIDTNIPEVQKIVYDDYVDNGDEGDPLEFKISDNLDDNSLVDAWKYAIPQMKLGAWNAILTVSSNAYGATGVSGSKTTSSSSDYADYYNYYNYYNSYYGNGYYNNYYNGYYGGYGGMMGGYGGYGDYGYGYGGYGDYYYNNYYNSYYYNQMYNNSYYTDDTTSTTTVTTEVQPYSPLLWQVYLEPRE